MKLIVGFEEEEEEEDEEEEEEDDDDDDVMENGMRRMLVPVARGKSANKAAGMM